MEKSGRLKACLKKHSGNISLKESRGSHSPTVNITQTFSQPLADSMHLFSLSLSKLLRASHSSRHLFIAISETPNAWMRTQLCRVFKKYVSPQTPVEMLKRKRFAAKICEDFGHVFRDIVEVQKRFAKRPFPDEALCAVLWEYKDRGKKGYDLTEQLFEVLRTQHVEFTIEGPETCWQ